MTSENKRCILLLQGPLSKYYARTAHHLEKLGAKTLKVHFCGSDVHDWEQTETIHFSEPVENWALFLEALMLRMGSPIFCFMGTGATTIKWPSALPSVWTLPSLQPSLVICVRIG